MFNVQQRDYKEMINNFFMKDFSLVDQLTNKLLELQIGSPYMDSTKILSSIIESGNNVDVQASSLTERRFLKNKKTSAQTVLDDIERNRANIALLEQETRKRLTVLDELGTKLQDANTALSERLNKQDSARREIVFSFPSNMHPEINAEFDRILNNINLNLTIQQQLISNIKLMTSTYTLVMESISILYDTLVPTVELFNVLQKQRSISKVTSDADTFKKSKTSVTCREHVITSFSMMGNTIDQLNKNLNEAKGHNL